MMRCLENSMIRLMGDVTVLIPLGFTCPVGYSITAVATPKAFLTQMMTVWGMSMSTGAALNTLIVNFYKEGNEIPFFLAIGGTVCIIGLIVGLFGKNWHRG
nr:hypothetical protein [uncultured Clostridium sp.]